MVNPRFTAGWLDYAQHCGFVTDAARVRSPKDKPRVEWAVQYVRGNFSAGEALTGLATGLPPPPTNTSSKESPTDAAETIHPPQARHQHVR